MFKGKISTFLKKWNNGMVLKMTNFDFQIWFWNILVNNMSWLKILCRFFLGNIDTKELQKIAYFHTGTYGYWELVPGENSNWPTIAWNSTAGIAILPKDLLRYGRNTSPNIVFLKSKLRGDLGLTYGATFGWIFWTITSCNLKKFTSR